MARSSAQRWTVVLAAACLLAATAHGRADQTDPRLNALFAKLQTTDRGTAAAAETQIWEIWLQPARDDVRTLVAQGLDAMNQGDQPGALAIFDRVLAEAPDYAEGWNKRATILYLMGRYADSIHDINRVLALEPRHFGALSGLGLCDVALDHNEAALSAFQHAAAIDPSLPGVQDNIAALKREIAKQRT